MTTKTYKQIAKEIESGKTLKAREKQLWNFRSPRYYYTIEIDGETFEVKAASWNKISSEFSVKTTEAKECGKARYIFHEISAK